MWLHPQPVTVVIMLATQVWHAFATKTFNRLVYLSCFLGLCIPLAVCFSEIIASENQFCTSICSYIMFQNCICNWVLPNMFSNSTAVFGSCGYTSVVVLRGGARLLLGIYCGITALDQSTQLQILIAPCEGRGEGSSEKEYGGRREGESCRTKAGE